MPLADFGAFSVAYSALFIVASLHNALIIEPAIIFGAGRLKEQLAAYTRELFRLHWAVSVLCSIMLLAGAGILQISGQQMLSQTFVGLAVSLPAVLFLWLCRRLCYITASPSLAALGGTVSLLITTGCAFWLYNNHGLNGWTAFLTMGAASLTSASLVALMLRRNLRPSGRFGLIKALIEHWQYGRWSLTSSVLYQIPTNVPYIALATWSGLEAVALMRVLLNLVSPILSFNAALANALLPSYVTAHHEGRLYKLITRAGVYFAASSILYWVALAVGGNGLLDFLFPGRYTEARDWLWIVGVFPLLSSTANAISSGLRVRETPRDLVIVHMYSALFTVTFGLFLQFSLGFTGAILSFIGSTALVLVGALLAFWKPPSLTSATPSRASSS
jgi:O-antigen/teichoic acid export membrane protein